MTCIQTLVILFSIAQKERCQCQEKWVPGSLRSQEALEGAVDLSHGGPCFPASVPWAPTLSLQNISNDAPQSQPGALVGLCSTWASPFEN